MSTPPIVAVSPPQQCTYRCCFRLQYRLLLPFPLLAWNIYPWLSLHTVFNTFNDHSLTTNPCSKPTLGHEYNFAKWSKSILIKMAWLKQAAAQRKGKSIPVATGWSFSKFDKEWKRNAKIIGFYLKMKSTHSEVPREGCEENFNAPLLLLSITNIKMKLHKVSDMMWYVSLLGNSF